MQNKWRRISFTLDATYDEDSQTEVDVNMSIDKKAEDDRDTAHDTETEDDVDTTKKPRKVSFKDEQKSDARGRSSTENPRPDRDIYHNRNGDGRDLRSTKSRNISNSKQKR